MHFDPYMQWPSRIKLQILGVEGSSESKSRNEESKKMRGEAGNLYGKGEDRCSLIDWMWDGVRDITWTDCSTDPEKDVFASDIF